MAVVKNKPKIKKQQKKQEQKSLFARLEKMLRMQHLFDEGVPVRYLPFGMFLMLLLLIYIGNNHYAERMHRKINRLESEVEDLRADYTTLYNFSATRRRALRARLFLAISSAEGSTGLRVTGSSGRSKFPYRSFSASPENFPLAMKCFTSRSSSE